MSKFRRTLRQTFTVVRRDFTATVFTPTFLLFLLAPLIFLSFSVIGGLGAASITDSGEDKLRIVVIAPPAQSATLLEVDKQLRTLFPKRNELMPPVRVSEGSALGAGGASAAGLAGSTTTG